MKTPSVKNRAVTATAWSSADLIVRQGVPFLVTLFLMRFVTPADFGIAAILIAFVGIAAVVVDSGLSTALIQRQDITHTDESTVFWLNGAVGLALALLIVVAARPASAFFAQPVLRELSWAGALTVFTSALGAIHATLLTKKLDFRTQCQAGLVATTGSSALAIALALRELGIWALAAQILSMATLYTASLWFLHRWRPILAFDMDSAKRLLGFGGVVLTANHIDTIYTRAYAILIGRFIGLRELGYYDRAENTKRLPENLLIGVLTRVSLPLLSEASGDRSTIHRSMRTTTRGVMLLNLPMMFGLAVLAEPVFELLFGTTWQPAVKPFQILCIAAALWPVHVININALLAQGHAGLVLKLEIPKKALGLTLLVLGLQFGIEGVAWSQVAFSFAVVWINTYYTKKLVGYGFLLHLKDITVPAVVAVGVAALVRWLSQSFGAINWFQVIALALADVGIYALVILSIYPPAREVVSFLRAARSLEPRP